MEGLYKNLQEITILKKKSRIKKTKNHLSINRDIDINTGEIKEFYPDNTRDRREKVAESRTAKYNSYFSKVSRSIKGDEWFYTVNLADVCRAWGDYNTPFNSKKMAKIRKWLKSIIVGPFYAVIEVCKFSGTHIHIYCRKQNPLLVDKILKAETHVYDAEGLLEYFSKPTISTDDRKTEEYDEMVGAFLNEKEKAKKRKKRCPRRVISSVKE
jgi:hypothetical protein